MTIQELMEREEELKNAWFDYFIGELLSYEDEAYVEALTSSGLDFNKVCETFILQGYWSAVRRNYYWSSDLICFITEGRF